MSNETDIIDAAAAAATAARLHNCTLDVEIKATLFRRGVHVIVTPDQGVRILTEEEAV